MKRILLITQLLFVLILTSCNGPKKLTKKGNELAGAGVHKQAVEFYIRALKKDQAHIPAISGLKSSGQAVMADYQSKFFKAYNNADYKTSVYTYMEMEKFQARLKRHNAEIDIPSHYQEDYKEAKNKYLENRFEEANNLMAQENFKGSEVILKEIVKLEPNYGGADLDKLMEIAKLEPPYREGNSNLDLNKNRAAYYAFKKVTDINVDYKDAKFKKEEALKLAQYPIAVMKFKNYSQDRGAEEKVSAVLLDELIRNKGPFLKVLDRSNMDKVLNEQYMSMNGWMSGNGAVKTGELIGAKAVLSGKILSVKRTTRLPQAKTVKAYKERRVRVYNQATDSYSTKMEYDKVSFQNYSGFNEFTVSFQFMLVSSETGEIILSEIVNKTVRSEVDYNTYGGNYKELLPGTWKFTWKKLPTDKISFSRKERKEMQAKFNGNKNLRAVNDLGSEALKAVGSTAGRKIYSFNPEQ